MHPIREKKKKKVTKKRLNKIKLQSLIEIVKKNKGIRSTIKTKKFKILFNTHLKIRFNIISIFFIFKNYNLT